MQLAILLGCGFLLGQFAWHFPYPAPLVRPFLDAKERWPEAQIREWAKTSEFRDDFWQFFTRERLRKCKIEQGAGVLGARHERLLSRNDHCRVVLKFVCGDQLGACLGVVIGHRVE